MTQQKVTVIGLGRMGSAIVRTLLKSGFAVTAWNRTAGKAEALKSDGATIAENVRAAIEASPLIITCVSDYAATRHLLSEDGLVEILRGKTLVELTTGTSQDARDAKSWADGLGLSYLDGAIGSTPDTLGDPETQIFLSGPSAIYKENQTTLKTLGNIQYVGEEIGLAGAYDLALLTYFWGSYLGFLNSVRIFENENIAVNKLGEMLLPGSAAIGTILKTDADHIHDENFEAIEATLDICFHSTNMINRYFEEAGLNPEITAFTKQFFAQGVAAGYGNDGLNSLIKLLRNAPQKNEASAR